VTLEVHLQADHGFLWRFYAENSMLIEQKSQIEY
jgi:hypothetical protein